MELRHLDGYHRGALAHCQAIGRSIPSVEVRPALDDILPAFVPTIQ